MGFYENWSSHVIFLAPIAYWANSIGNTLLSKAFFIEISGESKMIEIGLLWPF